MNTFIKFLVDYWQFISFAILVIFNLIMIIVKKRPLKEILDNSAYKDLLVLVRDAENHFGSGHGAEKLEYVLKGYCSIKGLDPDHWLYESIKQKVENILSTPEKKGDK